MADTLAAWLNDRGVENFHGPEFSLPGLAKFEPPCSLKWMGIHHSITMGAFSYAVSGYFFAVRIGRYVSIGEQVQIGRGDHPTTWLSTSPVFYERAPLFDTGDNFQHAADYRAYRPADGRDTGMRIRPVTIGHDVWIGHGAFIRPGVTIGTGAIVAAHAVVTRDVPPYAVVAGNPAVIKKYRVPEALIQPLLDSEWWHYAPWDLRDFSLDRPEAFVAELAQRAPSLTRYKPALVRAGDYR